jgi:hypothetical protein
MRRIVLLIVLVAALMVVLAVGVDASNVPHCC